MNFKLCIFATQECQSLVFFGNIQESGTQFLKKDSVVTSKIPQYFFVTITPDFSSRSTAFMSFSSKEEIESSLLI